MNRKKDLKFLNENGEGGIDKRKAAIIRAIDECIEEGILTDILTEHKEEVLEMVLTALDVELYEQRLSGELGMVRNIVESEEKDSENS